ncbi:MAG TPA: nuclear transport factor 2 family protein [Polyangiaceae bacterium]|nr:nuclear transport factor 2 family protein [Polyangiaceae bacterium]
MKSQFTRLTAAAIAGALTLPACRATPANPERDALQIVQRWATAFNESNVDTIASLYAPDALFFGTGSKSLVTAPADIRSYFEAALTKDNPRGAQLLDHSVKVLSDTVVLVTGLDRVTGTKDGSTYQRDGRVSFVLEKRADGWQIVHFHRSALPGS